MKDPKAFTLVEVLAALAIMASALAVLLTAQQRSLSLLKAQENKQVADGLARELITDWKLRPAHAPPLEGDFEGQSGWRWTRSEETMGEPDSKLRRIALTVYKRNDQRQDTQVSAYVWLELEHAQ